MIRIRAERRVALGPMLSVEFENAETLAYQAQETLYTERVRDPAAVVAEADLHRHQLPGHGELAATLFLELVDPASIRADLDRLAGVQHALVLEVAGTPVPGRELAGPDGAPPAAATQTVHLLRFQLPQPARVAFGQRDGGTVALTVDHPQYRARTELPARLRAILSAELAGPD